MIDLEKLKKENKKLKEKKEKSKVINRVLKEKILKKPKTNLPSYSAKRFISQVAISTEPLVREAEEHEIERDDRSLFFNDEYRNEKKDMFKWLGR